MGKSIDTLRREAHAAAAELDQAVAGEEEARDQARAEAASRVRAWDRAFVDGGFQDTSGRIGAEVKRARAQLSAAIDADPVMGAYVEILGGLLAQRFLVSEVYNLSATRLGRPARESGSRPPAFAIVEELERQVMDRASVKAHELVDQVLAEREAAAGGDGS